MLFFDKLSTEAFKLHGRVFPNVQLVLVEQFVILQRLAQTKTNTHSVNVGRCCVWKHI